MIWRCKVFVAWNYKEFKNLKFSTAETAFSTSARSLLLIIKCLHLAVTFSVQFLRKDFQNLTLKVWLTAKMSDVMISMMICSIYLFFKVFASSVKNREKIILEFLVVRSINNIFTKKPHITVLDTGNVFSQKRKSHYLK